MKTFGDPMVLISLSIFICCGSVFKTAVAAKVEEQCWYTKGLVSNKVKCNCCKHGVECNLDDHGTFTECNDSTGLFCTANPGLDASCSALRCTFEDGETENEETCQCGPESGGFDDKGTYLENKYVCDAQTTGLVCNYTSPGHASNACGCPAGRYATTAQSRCETCPDGFVSEAMATECRDIDQPNNGCPAGKHQAYEACKQCPTGYYQEVREKAYCQKCPEGYLTGPTGSDSADRQSCELGCEAGQYQIEGSQGNGGCAICPSGQYRTGKQGNTCIACPAGSFLSDNQSSGDKHDSPDDCFECAEGTFSLPGAEFCRQCPAGWYKDDNDVQMVDCAQCEAGYYTKKAAAQTCTGCDKGKYQSEPRRSFCLPCPSGFYADASASAICKNCAVGKFRADDYDGTTCIECPTGWYQNEESQSFCSLCGAGLYADQNNSVSCKQCLHGKFRGVTKANNLDNNFGSTCYDCRLGLYSTSQGTADCFPCAPGLYADQEGLKTCKNCAAKTFASGFRATGCGLCPLGWDTNDQDGASECVTCSKGRYGSELGTCSNCPLGQYTDDKEQTSCKLPSLGKVVNKAQTSEVRPPYKSAADCSNSQYLDDSRDRRDEWKCVDCPEGGDCSGFSVWSNIKPLNGYWRTVAESKKKRPDCVKEIKCPVFIKCLYPPACLGSNNPVLATILEDSWPNASVNHNESCNMAQGFANTSRLCQTCGTGYSRSWGSTCVACSDDATQKHDMSGLVVLFSFGFLFGILFYSGLVALRKRAFQNDATSKKRKKSMHSTMKRILLSHMQMINTIIHLSVPWPEILIQILNIISGVSGSFGDSANALECVYDNQSHSEFYLGALVVVAVLPFVFVGVLVVYWFCLARHSTKMGCGQTVEAWHYGSGSTTTTNHQQQLNDASFEDQTSVVEVTAKEEKTSSPTSTTLKSATSLSSTSLPNSKRTSKRQSSTHRNFRATSMDALIMSSVLFWFMILPSILRMGLVSLECKVVQDSNGDERVWMLIDLQQECGVGLHAHMMLVSIPLVLFHLLIVPLVIFSTLRRAGETKRQQDPSVMFRWGLIHSGYRNDRYWWEFVVLLRKVLLIFISTFASTDQLQLHLSLAVLIISLHLHDTNRPFGGGDDHGDDHGDGHHEPSRVITEGTPATNQTDLAIEEKKSKQESERALHLYEMMSLLCSLFLIWSGVFFYFNICSNSVVSCAILVLAVLGSNLTYLLVLAQRCVREWGKKNKKHLHHMMHALHLDRPSRAPPVSVQMVKMVTNPALGKSLVKYSSSKEIDL